MVQPGGEIHEEHPFATPAGERDATRRFRGRLAAAVTLWTAGDGAGRVGLTVASTMVVDGAPTRLLGMIDPDSDLSDALTDDGRFCVLLLADRQRRLADQFAGLMPAPGGLFAQDDWTQTEHGPVLADTPGWLACRVDATAEMGWGLRVEATVLDVTLADDEPGLVYRRGRYYGVPASG